MAPGRDTAAGGALSRDEKGHVELRGRTAPVLDRFARRLIFFSFLTDWLGTATDGLTLSANRLKNSLFFFVGTSS